MTKKPTRKPKTSKSKALTRPRPTSQLVHALESIKAATAALARTFGLNEGLGLIALADEARRRFETIEAWKLAIHERLAGFLERRPKPSRITLAATTQAIEDLLEQVLDREAKAERELGADRRRIGDQLRRILGVQLRYHTVDELLAMAEERLRDAPKPEDVQALIAERDEANELIRTLAYDLSSGDEQEKIEDADNQTCREALRAKVAELTTLSMMLETVGSQGKASAPVNGVMLLSIDEYNSIMSERERIKKLVSMTNGELLALVDKVFERVEEDEVKAFAAELEAPPSKSLIGVVARRLADLIDLAEHVEPGDEGPVNEVPWFAPLTRALAAWLRGELPRSLFESKMLTVADAIRAASAPASAPVEAPIDLQQPSQKPEVLDEQA